MTALLARLLLRELRTLMPCSLDSKLAIESVRAVLAEERSA